MESIYLDFFFLAVLCRMICLGEWKQTFKAQQEMEGCHIWVFFLNSICFLNQLLGEVEPFKGAQATQAMAICWHGLCLDSTHIFYTCAIT